MTISQHPAATIPLGQTSPAPGTTLPSGSTAPAAQAFPPLKMTVKKKLPTGVASNVKQRVLFLLDHSSSMSGEKIQELEMAMGSILLQLADPSNKGGFLVTVIPFNHASHVLCAAEAATSVPALNLIASGGTNFDSPILAAISEIEAFKARPNPDGWQYLQPQVLFLSDGQSRVSDKNIQDLQERANVTAVAYGADANQDILSRIASDGQVHIVGDNGGALRDFLAAVGATMVSTIKAAM
ncbi:vWA domain-containing protein [Marinovum sp. 2_MG-2023]|uniref:vWA domain-containing protein n=1 Tax=unclassified Marinovum TaxID=2647166 RepID=UPI0026E3373F|nr:MULTISPECIES: vWA domain-containing protein [unclassified Marinovum]MDO6730707.1 vWA domain-containing protein [Marinovum sp. 2_MG-2023]MDO6780088.1 vWA domain-containing protein [Marinovum sp. 1_MG-2023]